MTMLQVIDGRERDLGGFVVRRVLPFEARPMVGPFIFFDHLGPAQFAAGQGIDVRPHPHIGIATVTYLFSGALEHRDSLGNVRVIAPGDVNWMTAGQGIAHSERTPQAARAAGPQIHGIQSWVALPDGEEDVAPSFVHHSAATLPRLQRDGLSITVIAGHGFGLQSPVATRWPTLYADVDMQRAARVALPEADAELAVYVVQGGIEADGTALGVGQMGIVAPGTTLDALGPSRLMVLGGEKFPTPRHLYWNFVASTPERIEAAKSRWRSQAFARVPEETEFIPLPA